MVGPLEVMLSGRTDGFSWSVGNRDERSVRLAPGNRQGHPIWWSTICRPLLTAGRYEVVVDIDAATSVLRAR
jgi:hypothetical protein